MTPERLAFNARIIEYTRKELISLAVEQYDRICELEIREKENSRINTEAHISYKKLESEVTDLKKENLSLKVALQKEIDKNLVLNRKVYGRATEKFIDSLQGTNGEEHIDEAETEDNEQDGHPSRVIDITALQGKPVHAETEGDQKTSQTSGSANRFCRYHGQGKQAGTHNKLNAAADSLPQDVHYQFDPEAYDEKYGEGNWRIAFWQETKTIEKLPLSYYQKVVYTPVISSGLEHVLSNEQTPPHLINRSLASPSLVADIFYRKVFLSLPNGRQERDYKISGLPLSKQTMIQWTNQLTQEVLTVPYQYLSTLLLRLKYTQNDETYMQVNKDGRGAGSKSFLWVHCSSELLDCPPIIIFCYEKTRGTDHLRKFFKEFSGYITCDAYAAYQTFAKEHPETDDVTGCMMHCRRYFAIAFFVHDFKDLSDQQILELPETTAILKIKEIYSEENKLKGLNFEITESSMMDIGLFHNVMQRLINAGSFFSLDDYGTGFSNLINVLSLPFHTVKIDKSIAWAYFQGNDQVLPEIIRMFLNRNLQILVEGVETQEMAQKLIEMQCQLEQGYYFSRPIPEQSFLKYLKDFS